jgi:hypothetical protein
MILTGKSTGTEARRESMIGIGTAIAATGIGKEPSGIAVRAGATGSVNVILVANAVTENVDSAATAASEAMAVNEAMAVSAVSAAMVANEAGGLTRANANGEIANLNGNASVVLLANGSTPAAVTGVGKIGARQEGATTATIGAGNRNMKVVLVVNEKASGTSTMGSFGQPGDGRSRYGGGF